MGSGESADIGLPGLENTSDTSTWYDLLVSGDGSEWSSLLDYVRPGVNTTSHHVVDLGAALSSAGISADSDVICSGVSGWMTRARSWVWIGYAWAPGRDGCGG